MRKREGLFYNWQRIVAALLIIVVSMTSLSLENLAADNVLQEENSVEKYEISRDNVIESENTENSTTYDMGDGLRVTEFYAQDVRFQDIVPLKRYDKQTCPKEPVFLTLRAHLLCLVIHAIIWQSLLLHTCIITRTTSKN